MDDEDVDYERPFRIAYCVYEWLRDSPVIRQSKTSELLHNPNFESFSSKIDEEIEELKNVAAGKHKHSGNQRDDILYESHQVWYWLAVSNVSVGIGYDEIAPHASVSEGYENGFDGQPDITVDDENLLKKTTDSCLRFVGSKFRNFEIKPFEIAEYDLNEMGGKPYLKEALTELGFI